MTTPLEVLANGLNALSIVLAGRNSVHTWWTGILGCAAFAFVFYGVRLYADVTLQAFFVATSAIGWWGWARGHHGAVLPVRRSSARFLASCAAAGVVVAVAYAALLWRFTNAYAPLVDSTVLAFSALGQILLMARRLEAWWFWLLVNTLAVPLFLSRGLYVTAALYACFWVNAWLSLGHWRRLVGAR